MQDVEIIIRAWKDDEYRMDLGAEEQQKLPENPAGVVEVSESILNSASGRFFTSQFGFTPFC